MVTRTKHIADLLMAAAHADPQRSRSAYDVVCTSLKQVMGASYILTSIDERLRAFDPESFSLKETLEGVSLQDDAEKRQLLELIAAVHDAEDVIAVDKDVFLREVAEAIGMSEEDYEDLTVEVQEARESLYERRDSLIEARNSLLGPPPLPKP